MSDYKEQLDSVNSGYKQLTQASGDPAKDFLALHADALKDGAVSAQKQGIDVSVRRHFNQM